MLKWVTAIEEEVVAASVAAVPVVALAAAAAAVAVSVVAVAVVSVAEAAAVSVAAVAVVSVVAVAAVLAAVVAISNHSARPTQLWVRSAFQRVTFDVLKCVLAAGEFLHPCEGDMVCKGIMNKVPQFNAFIFLENKTQIGKIDEVFGPLNSVMFTVKPSEGFVATSFKAGDKVYIAPEKTLPLERFLPAPYVCGL